MNLEIPKQSDTKGFFFAANFRHLGNIKKRSQPVQNMFSGKKCPQLPYFEENNVELTICRP